MAFADVDPVVAEAPVDLGCVDPAVVAETSVDLDGCSSSPDESASLARADFDGIFSFVVSDDPDSLPGIAGPAFFAGSTFLLLTSSLPL